MYMERVFVCMWVRVERGRKRKRERENFLVVFSVRTNWLFWAGIRLYLRKFVCMSYESIAIYHKTNNQKSQ